MMMIMRARARACLRRRTRHTANTTRARALLLHTHAHAHNTQQRRRTLHAEAGLVLAGDLARKRKLALGLPAVLVDHAALRVVDLVLVL